MPRPSHMTLPLLMLLFWTPQVDAQQGDQHAESRRGKGRLDAHLRRPHAFRVVAERRGGLESGGRDAHRDKRDRVSHHAQSLRKLRAQGRFLGRQVSQQRDLHSLCRRDARGDDCYEVNIFDAHAEWPTGSVNNVKTVLPERPNTTEKWNTFEITADGTHLVIKINGKTTVDARDERRANGTIALQEGGANAFGVIRFRNVKIRPL